MKSKYELLIWDVDGTLLDTSEGIISSAIYSIRKHSLDIPSEDVMKTFIGPPIQDSFQRVFKVKREEAMAMADDFRNYYKFKDLFKAKKYPHLDTTLNKITQMGVKQVVATYKRQDYANSIIDHFGLNKFMIIVCGADFEGKLNKSDIIQKAISKSGVSELRKIVMVGDTVNDLTGAQNLKIDFIGVLYGFGFKEYDSINYPHTVGIIDSVEKIIPLLRGEEK